MCVQHGGAKVALRRKEQDGHRDTDQTDFGEFPGRLAHIRYISKVEKISTWPETGRSASIRDLNSDARKDIPVESKQMRYPEFSGRCELKLYCQHFTKPRLLALERT